MTGVQTCALPIYNSKQTTPRFPITIEIGEQKWDMEKGACNIPRQEIENIEKMVFIFHLKNGAKQFYFKDCKINDK